MLKCSSHFRSTCCPSSDCHRLGNTDSLLPEVSGIWAIRNADMRFSACWFSYPEQTLEKNVLLLQACRSEENSGLFELFSNLSRGKLAWGQYGHVWTVWMASRSHPRFKLLRSWKSFRTVICTLLIIEDLIKDDWALMRLAKDAKVSSWQVFRFLLRQQQYREKDVNFHSRRMNTFFSTLILKTARHFSCIWKHYIALFSGSVIHHP